MRVQRSDGAPKSRMTLLCRIDTLDEVEYYRQRRHPAVRPAPPSG